VGGQRGIVKARREKTTERVDFGYMRLPWLNKKGFEG
jgi:hypothetical protein